MARFDLDTMIANTGDYARGYTFFASIQNIPSGVDLPPNYIYLVRSSSLPEGTIEPIVSNWQGREYKIAGTQTFSEVEISFNVDAEGKIRRSFLNWQKQIYNPITGIHGKPSLNDGYFATVVLEHLNTAGKPIQVYNLVGAWPSSVGSQEMSYDNKDIAQLSVTFSYLYYVVDGVHTETQVQPGVAE